MKKYLKALPVVILLLVPAWLYLLFYTPENSTEDISTKEEQSLAESATEERIEPEAEESQSEMTEIEAIGQYTIGSVVDGDTFRVSDGTELLTVRVLGIDAPETKHSLGGAECYNEESTMAAKKLLAGSLVTLYRDYSQDLFDTYGRVIAYVSLADGTDFGLWMLENGYAEEYTFKGIAYDKQSTYREAETEAKGVEKGLWACGN